MSYAEAQAALIALGRSYSLSGLEGKSLSSLLTAILIRGNRPSELCEGSEFDNALRDALFSVVACSDPAAPSDLAATPPAPNTTISWTDNATNETSYEIRYRNLTQGGAFNNEPPLPADSTGAIVVIGNPSPADVDQIEIQVRAVSGSCVSDWVSITVTAEILN